MTTMQDLLTKNGAGVKKYRAGANATGTVIDVTGSRILVDLPGGKTGIITKKEASTFGEVDESVVPGAELEAAIIDAENEHGLVVMSLRRASQDMIWAELNDMIAEERSVKVKIEEANKGGLMAKYKGVRAFLPVSQLTPMNYPRVDNADPAQILAKLQAHIGKEFVVRVINVDRERGKVILSEKAAHSEMSKETLANMSVGDVVKGHVSGVVKFGIFVSFGGVEGLVHLSELDWGHVSDPSKKYRLGDEVEVMVIGMDGTKLSFSIKRLSEDPWKHYVENYAQGDVVDGTVIRWNTHGVFVQVTPQVQGFMSIDQFPVESYTELPLKTGMKEGMPLKGEIIVLNYESRRLELKNITA